ncbi:MAG: TauD/TfdA family dioxygenase [Methylophagaceae bacterium]
MNLSIVEASAAELDEKLVVKTVIDSGMILIRSKNHSVDDFLAFSKKFSTEFISLNERQRTVGGNSGRETVEGNKSLFTVTGKNYGHDVPLHGELYFQQVHPPQLLWFYCAHSIKPGGETWLCDGQELFSGMALEMQKLFMDSDIIYERHHTKVEWMKIYSVDTIEALKKYLQTKNHTLVVNDDDSIITYFKTSPLRKNGKNLIFINNILPFALREIHTPNQTKSRVKFVGGKEIPKDVILELEQLATSLMVKIPWEKGDIVIVDNTRMLHGRGIIDDFDREIYVRMSQTNLQHYVE